jgi:enoyl-[acyl-carrier protein] reductase II
VGGLLFLTFIFKLHGIKVVHVVSSVKFALKSEQVGVDAIVAEGFEAGGHNGKEETTTLVLVPMVADAVKIPVIAAGGIASGKALLAAISLGAEAVQIGTRFASSLESSSHLHFKEEVIKTVEGGTELILKQLTPVRLIKNDLYKSLKEAELRGANKEELILMLGKGRAKKGMFEGELTEGELEIGQVAAQIQKIESADEIMDDIISDFNKILLKVKSI